MSLFGAKKQPPPLKELLGRAKENFEKRMAKESTSGASVTCSSHIGDLIEKSTSPEPDAMGGPVVLPRAVYNEMVRMHNDEAKQQGLLSQIISTVHGGSSMDEEGNLVSKQPRVYTILSEVGSSLLPPPMTNYGGSEISFPSQTARDNDDLSELSPPPSTSYGGSDISFPSETPGHRAMSPLPAMNYEGSLLGLPLSALPEDPFSTPKASAGLILQRYIQSEENTSQHATKEGGMEETWKV